MNLANNTIDFVQQSSAEKSGQGDALTDLGGETMDLPSGRSGQLEAAETVHVEKHDLQSNPDDDLDTQYLPAKSTAQLSSSMVSTQSDLDSPKRGKKRSDSQRDGAATDELLGKKLGSFQLLRKIGSGGTAQVYLALDTILMREVAVKVVSDQKYLTHDHLVDQLVEEGIAQASLNHPNIVTIYFVGKDLGKPYLAMEFVEGESLQELIEKRRLRIEEVYQFSQQIATALLHAKEKHVVHGDIKPANLLIDSKGNLKLSDFGLSRKINEEKSRNSGLVGTPAYMAPELFEGNKTDEQSDLFSLGVTFYQMTFRSNPYQLYGQTAEEVKMSLDLAELNWSRDQSEYCPAAWTTILHRLLSKQRSNRYRCIEDLADDLASLDLTPNLCP